LFARYPATTGGADGIFNLTTSRCSPTAALNINSNVYPTLSVEFQSTSYYAVVGSYYGFTAGATIKCNTSVGFTTTFTPGNIFSTDFGALSVEPVSRGSKQAVSRPSPLSSSRY
jgi:hypothetical protein